MATKLTFDCNLKWKTYNLRENLSSAKTSLANYLDCTLGDMLLFWNIVQEQTKILCSKRWIELLPVLCDILSLEWISAESLSTLALLSMTRVLITKFEALTRCRETREVLEIAECSQAYMEDSPAL